MIKVGRIWKIGIEKRGKYGFPQEKETQNKWGEICDGITVHVYTTRNQGWTDNLCESCFFVHLVSSKLVPYWGGNLDLKCWLNCVTFITRKVPCVSFSKRLKKITACLGKWENGGGGEQFEGGFYS